jgi:hypothetical protein
MKKHLISTALGLALGLLLFISCEKETPKETPAPPAIGQINSSVTVNESGEVKLKIGGSVTLHAMVENAVNPVFSWKVDGKIISTTTSYTFTAEALGEYFVNFRVDAENGSDEKQVKISVLEKLPPQITLQAVAMAYAGIDKVFTAEAENAENATYVWRLAGEIVSTATTYTFNQWGLGNYLLTLRVTTDEGEDLKTITITVLPEPLPELFFDDGRYRTATNAGTLRKMTVPAGRDLVLAPVICNIPNPTSFAWTVDGVSQAETGEYFTFSPPTQATYLISVTEKSTNVSATVEVTCTPAEGTYRRTDKTGKKPHAAAAFDYGPAPGQFVDYQSNTTKAKALQDLQTWCNNGVQTYFHIGAFGGYFIVGFDHSVANEPGKADLQISGNAFASWCESGIVWVMQDENGNGQPDDTWYELKGSETGKPDTKQRCVMTYYKPKSANANVLWTDNTGRSGSVDWNGYHTQQYYYPMFITEDSYTLTGTCLASTAGMSGLIEISTCYDWGYVDGINSNSARPNSAHFWIEDAIQVNGAPVELKYIDFVKVHTATTGKGAAVGEVSTEANLPVDLNF